MKFETEKLDENILEPGGDGFELASIQRGNLLLYILVFKDDDSKIQYEYHLNDRQHAKYHWRAPRVGGLKDDQLFKLLYQVLEEEEKKLASQNL